MRYSRVGRALTVSLAVGAIGAAGCGSSKNKTTTTTNTRSAASSAGAAAPRTYRAGEFCSTKKAAVYKAQGFKCVKVKGTFRLQKS
jgi:hypothetical protein